MFLISYVSYSVICWQTKPHQINENDYISKGGNNFMTFSLYSHKRLKTKTNKQGKNPGKLILTSFLKSLEN